MRADCYTAFLTDKVKVFPTDRKIKPFVLPKRLIRKAYPFLLAASMTVTLGCNVHKESPRSDTNKSEVETVDNKRLASAYSDVVETYNLTSLGDKEPFTEKEISDLLAIKTAPALNDTNFNHCPASEENFWEIVKNGILVTNEVIKSDNLTDAQKAEYKITAYKMLSQMSKIKDSKDKLDLSDYKNLKTFIYFEKVIKFKDNYHAVLGHVKGCSDERDEFLGRYYKEFDHLVEEAEKYPGVDMFIKAFYNNNDRFILSPKDSVEANRISKEMFNQWLKKQNIKRTDLISFETMDNDPDYINTFRFLNHRGDLFFAAIFVESRGKLGDNCYAPVGETAIHEISHLMQFKPTSNETPEDNKLSDEDAQKLPEGKYKTTLYAELGPSLHSLVVQDQIYKKIHHIKEDEVVDYGVTINTLHQKIPVGEIAVWFFKMEKKYPSSSIDRIVSQPEVLRQLNTWGSPRAKVASRTAYYSDYAY